MNTKSKFCVLRIDSFFPLILLVIGFLIITQVVITYFINIKLTAQQDYFFTLLVLYGTIFIWLKKVLSKNTINILDECSLNNKIFRILLLGIILTIFSAGIFEIYIEVFSTFIPSLADKIMEILSKDSLEEDLLFFTINRIIIIFIAPVIEETIFRGILLHKWGRKYGFKKAVIITSIIFAILHLNIIGGFIFSLVVSLLYLKNYNLLIPIILHMIYNFIYTISLYLEKININLADMLLVKFLPFQYSSLLLFLLFIIISYIIFINWNYLSNEKIRKFIW